MSMLPADVLASLGSLLQALQSPDNVIRTKAEESLNVEWVDPRPDVLLMGLVELIQQGGDVATRGFAAVLFRKIANRSAKEENEDVSKDLFMKLSEPQQKAICSKLLECLGQESTANVRGKVADAVAEIARQYILEERIWSELLEALFTMSHSGASEHRETAFRIFATTPDIIQKQHEDIVLRVFQEGFKDEAIPVRLAAMEAFSSFFAPLNKKAQKKYFKLVGDILSILPPVKSAEDPEHLTRALVALVELADIAPNMFKDHFHDLVTFSISVVQDKDLEDQARQNALELMCTFAESNPVMCRKDASYTTQMVTQCLSLMTDVGTDDDDAAEWNAEEDLETDESDLNHVVGEQCMDRLANKLGGGALLQPTFSWLPQMMSSTAWRDRHAALMAISAISEGCHDMMVGELDKVLDLVIPALQDSHPRVRWAGCNALGQMSTDFANTMQENYHQRVLPAIIPVLNSKEHRVQAHAAASLVNFCEEAEKDILEPYLDQLLGNLLSLLQSPKRFVQEQALSTIATVADSAENSFEKYYSTLMPLLFNVLKSVQEKEMRLLKAKAMECATLIGLAVGKQKMGQDAVELVQVLYSIQENITEDDDPQANYILHCWGRMCRVLGKDFLPYLSGVVPPLLKQAAIKADVQVMDDEDEASQLKADDEWEILQIKGKYISVKTAALDDKQTALDLITVHAQHLEESFDPYVDQIMDDIAIGSLTFFFHDAVRCSAAKLIPQLLSARIKAHGQEAPQTTQLWAKVIERVLECLGTEPSTETLAELYQCFYESVEAMGKNCLKPEHMQSFIELTQKNLDDYLDRVRGRLDEAQDKEEGEEEDEDVLFAIEDDQSLLSDMNKAFHTIMKQHGAAFLPYWSRLMGYYDQFVSNNDPTQRQWALCIFDDLLEFCGPESSEYQSHILEPLVNGVKDQAPANRQAAAYGAGVAAQKGGPTWADFSAGILPSLFDATTHPQARLEDHVYATENACAAIAKVLHFNSGKVTNPQDFVNHWLETLPVTHDDEAAPYAYSFLAQLIEQSNPAVTSRAPMIIDVVCQALAAETLTGNTATRVANATKALIQSAGVDAGEILRMLPPESQQVVSSYF